jgi:hypothetical protein
MHNAQNGINAEWIGSLHNPATQFRWIPLSAEISARQFPSAISVDNFHVGLGVIEVLFLGLHLDLGIAALARRDESFVAVLQHA